MEKKQEIQDWFQGLQDRICKGLEDLDGKSTFREDKWMRAEGGGGRSRVIEEGKVFEKGGVNFSAVYGPTPEKILQALKLDKADFFATGVSIVIHPENPWVPIIHMNVRYFEMSNGVNWFGGGIDLTPHYINKNDAQYFHSRLKETCDKIDSTFYPEHKQWADDYFYLKHRKETRGVGGIFFDRLSGNAEEFDKHWRYVQKVGDTFLPAYSEIVKRNWHNPYSQQNKQWQLIRRGRYVEFNLVWDKGTKFGLDTDGRTESILMSLPPVANWVYDFYPSPGSLEEKTQSQLRKGINWLEN